ncbi:MAG: six-cysteine ranthipeptide SCIFF [Clostridiales bacterium]|nr:six-cysteine ranthipeptide SCIFF [Clostridiales bacterium]MDD7432265.1 six-cysteine ranthipeptide SCIFF [Clostridiales bacterium]MDY3062239.1 six-cysteine ranthipeptide SCIFF [Eubacteriales bacterium]
MKHIEIIQKPCQTNPAGGHACSECQTSCQSACKTSCTVGNQPCENEER